MDNNSDNIELRSEKVRNLVGRMPQRLVRMGTIVISFVMFVLLLAMRFVRYPQAVEATGVMITPDTARLEIPFKYMYKSTGMKRIALNFEGDKQSAVRTFSLSRLDRRLHHSPSGNYFLAYVYTGPYSRPVGLAVDAGIIVSDRTLWQILAHSGE